MLECIALIITSNEIDSGRFQTFMKQFENIKKCGISFLIFTNKFTHKTQTLVFRQEVYYYTRAFNSVEIICLNIPSEDDIYMRKDQFAKTKQAMPKFGLCSGPNTSFFCALDYCKKFDTTLLLETDCIITLDAIDSFINYAQYAGDFLVAGAKYDGKFFSGNILDIKHTHLNGVALYKTGNSEFQNLLNNVENWIIQNVPKQPSLPYDTAITLFILEEISSGNSEYYRSVFRRLVPTTLILNYSIFFIINPFKILIILLTILIDPRFNPLNLKETKVYFILDFN
jgi:hypothetical protein